MWRNTKINIWILPVVALLLAVLSACGGGEPQTVEVEATRVVIEEIEEEVLEEAAEEVLAEEEMIEEEMVEETVVEAIGTEEDGEESPFTPAPGPKVEATRPAGWIDESAVGGGDEFRAETAEGEIAFADAEVMAESASMDAVAEAAPRATGGGGGGDAVKSADVEAPSLDGDLAQGSELTAGDVDDNAQWDDYLLYRLTYEGAPVIEVDVQERHQIFVRNGNGEPILGARLRIETNGADVATLRTHSDGRAYFFPLALAENEQGAVYEVTAEFNGVSETFSIPSGESQRVWEVALAEARPSTDDVRLDVLFLIDTTGSMADEIDQLRDNIQAIAGQIDALPSQPNVRYGMTVYRDRQDLYTTRTFEFTPDVAFFAEGLSEVVADGGGDYPEDLNEGLFKAVGVPEWRVEETISLMFLITDAPPQLIYEDQNFSYATEMVRAAERGIKIYPIGSSGLDPQGEFVLRQLAQYTGGRFLFLTYGAEGAGSTGTETDLAVTDYDVTSLDGLVLKIIEEELALRE